MVNYTQTQHTKISKGSWFSSWLKTKIRKSGYGSTWTGKNTPSKCVKPTVQKIWTPPQPKTTLMRERTVLPNASALFCRKQKSSEENQKQDKQRTNIHYIGSWTPTNQKDPNKGMFTASSQKKRGTGGWAEVSSPIPKVTYGEQIYDALQSSSVHLSADIPVSTVWYARLSNLSCQILLWNRLELTPPWRRAPLQRKRVSGTCRTDMKGLASALCRASRWQQKEHLASKDYILYIHMSSFIHIL